MLRALALSVFAAQAMAQVYPAKSLRLVMPYPAGGSTDIVGRLTAESLVAALGQSVVVDNRPGASAQIGTEAVARAPADGYTLLMATSTNAITHAMGVKLPYDFAADFQPVALIARAGQLLVVHPSLPARTLKDFVALARSRPGQLTYASSGTGTSGHLAMEALAVETGLKLIHVPYKGNAPALNDMLGGQVTCGFANVVSVLPHVGRGRLRAIALSSAKRSALAPEVPTIAELGHADFDISAWFGLMVRAGVPAAIVARLNQETVQALKNRATQERLSGLGVDAAGMDSVAAFGEFLRADIQRWARLIKAANLRL
jgi:tripartite-type tricarboxylate transporter receptor subunit TctC